MKQKLFAKIRFSPELQDFWPTLFLTAEAHLNDNNEDVGPWSMHADLLHPPAQSGISLAWISFLSPKAPFTELPPHKPFKLTLGRTVIAKCIISDQCITSVQPQSEMPHTENDFVNDPHNSIRKAA